ncbi:hypothetical protein QJQ45_005325 [Haematococcus lacustris]|nr:hypothetical protein QJQ45_005325 [Haematococcus lacustris]
MLREACQQLPGRVVLVHEFRVSSAHDDVVAGQAESFRWLHPARSMATRSRIRGLMCSASKDIRFYDRDVSAALNIRRIAAGPGRPRQLRSWRGRPAMPNPGGVGQEWVPVRDKGLLRKWQRRHQRFCHTSAKEATRFTREQLRAYLLYHKVPPRDQPVGSTLVAGWQKAVQKHIAERGSRTGHGVLP